MFRAIKAQTFSASADNGSGKRDNRRSLCRRYNRCVWPRYLRYRWYDLLAKEKFEFESIPTFAPEHFMRVRQKDTLKRKQFVRVQRRSHKRVRYRYSMSLTAVWKKLSWALWAFFSLKFWIQNENEYNVDLFKEGLPYSYIRWIDNKDIDPKTLKLSSDTKLVKDFRDNYLLLFTSEWNIRWALERNEGLELSEFNRGDLQ